MNVVHIFGVVLLIGINALFSATEFSLVAVRASRIRELAEGGDSRARIVEHLLGDIGRVVSGVQVGLTLANLMLGYLGEVTLGRFLDPLFQEIPIPWAAAVAHGAAFVFAFGILTILQVVLGELVPKSLSLARAEQVSLLVARPFQWFLKTFRWAIDFVDGFSGKIVLAPSAFPRPDSHMQIRSTDELKAMVDQAQDRGIIPAAEGNFIQNAIDLRRVQVREVMVPRPDMHALPSTASLEDTMSMFVTTQRSRIPVYEGTLDHVLGFVHIKDLVWVLVDRAHRAQEQQRAQTFVLRSHLREVLIVPETKPASELLVEFRSRRAGLAMVVDEFGSILGLATLEDILEQMVGKIHDEFDVVEGPIVLSDGAMIFDGAIKLRDLETQYNIALPDDASYETIGGFVLNRLGFIPRGGEGFEAAGYRFNVVEMDKRRVSRVKLKPLRKSTDAGAKTSEAEDTDIVEQTTAPSESESPRETLPRGETPVIMLKYISLRLPVLRSPRSVADRDDGVSSSPHRPGRSRGADAGGRRASGGFISTSPLSRVGSARSRSICALLGGGRAWRSRRIVSFSTAGYTGDSRSLPRHPGTRLCGAPGVRSHWNSSRNSGGTKAGNVVGSRRGRFHASRPVRA